MEPKRQYEFSWSLLGDIGLGRPNLGNKTRVEVYRLMQFTFRDIIEKRHGTEEADKIFYESGLLAGKAFYDEVIGKPANLEAFCSSLQSALKELGIGILRFEKTDLEKGHLILSVSEDLDCSGLPELHYEVCTYDEGFIAALLQSFFGESFSVKEVDCWCTGSRTCRFKATANRNI